MDSRVTPSLLNKLSIPLCLLGWECGRPRERVLPLSPLLHSSCPSSLKLSLQELLAENDQESLLQLITVSWGGGDGWMDLTTNDDFLLNECKNY